jgi:hypothetical protein
MAESRSRPRVTPLTGTPDQMRTQVVRLRAQAARTGQPVNLQLQQDAAGIVTGGRVVIGTPATERAVATRTPHRPRELSRKTRRAVVITAASVALAWVITVIWLLAAALSWVGDHLAALAVVAALLAYVAAATTTRCPGLHCAGCKH